MAPPDVTRGLGTDEGGHATLDLVADDGSRAEIGLTPGPDGHRVRQFGPRRLWDRVEDAITFWTDSGRPSYEQFGVTATLHEQYVWFDDPTGPKRWSLSTADTRQVAS